MFVFFFLSEKPEKDSSIPTDISDYIDKIDQDDDEEEVMCSWTLCVEV